MNIKCLFGHHDWRFSYNWGMPLGISSEDTDKMFKNGTTYPVHQCIRCGKEDSELDAAGSKLRAEGRSG